jgi:hypothetical protein
MDIKDVMAGDLYCELIFLVDTSGSMAGSAMENTKNTLQIFLRSLPELCRFNIFQFNSTFTQLFADGSRSVLSQCHRIHHSVDLMSLFTCSYLRPYNDESLASATAWVAQLKASGGTEILPPLQKIFKTDPIEGHPRQIFLLTDGQVSNTAAVIDITKDNASTSRMFTFGIGNSVDHTLVNGMAIAGGGKAEFVTRNDLIAEKVASQLARALQPAIAKVTIDWGQATKPKEGVEGETGEPGGSGETSSTSSVPGGPQLAKSAIDPKLSVTNAMIKQCPAVLPPIYPGTRYFVYGLVDSSKLSFADSFDVKVT